MWHTHWVSAQRKASSAAKSKQVSRGGASVSLASLAAHLNLSTAAISRVLNQVPAAKSIPAATQDRIFAAARSMNYRPNVLARSLRRGLSMTIGVLVPEISEGFATLVLAGVEQGLRSAGYAFLLCSHHHDEHALTAAQEMLAERAVDGIIAIDTLVTEPGLTPMVTVSCPAANAGITKIVLNHQGAARLALEHLMALGHTRIALMKGQHVSSDTAMRWEAICATAAGMGLSFDPLLQIELMEDTPAHEPGYLATKRLLARGCAFTALLAFNDISAIGAIRALREAALRVPQDVSVVGFDDIQSAAYQNPALTTVRQPLHAMGLLAAESILAHLGAQQQQAQRTSMQVEPELVVRESTMRAPKRAKAIPVGQLIASLEPQVF